MKWVPRFGVLASPTNAVRFARCTGADYLYAPGVPKPEHIAALVQAVSPKPLNVVMSAPDLT
jgi:2-methylisocitrate lyase-like PEP mutase family enzyme